MSTLVELLYEALHSDLGIVVETEDAPALRQRLYRVAKSDEDFATLSFHLSPTNPTGELWIKKKGATHAGECETKEA